MSDLVLEIGTEELPASWVAPALAQLSQLLADALRRERIPFRSVRTYGTSRRLAVYAAGVAPRQPDSVVEIRGPATKQAFDAEGNYTSAAFGFARSQSVFPEELKVKRVTGGEFLFVERPRPGLSTMEVAARLLPEMIAELVFPGGARPEDAAGRPGRPIRWILALYGPDVIPFEFAAIQSGRATRGHRTSPTAADPLVVAEASAYPTTLEAASVILDPDERRERLRAQAESLARGEGALLMDDGLLEETTFLAECPCAFRGALDPGCLALPRDALLLVLRKERCFPLADEGGALLPCFIAVHDGGAEGIAAARADAEGILRARLSAIRRMHAEDRRVSLSERVEQLRGMPYRERLGTLHEKAERLVALTGRVCDLWGVDDGVRRTAERAAWLAKADLASAMAREMPDLRGTIGRAHALEAGEPKAVADAIADHYRPRASDGRTPLTEAGRLVGIADRIDTLVGHFAIGLVPFGSQDPHGLRQEASGLVAILVGAPSLSLVTLVDAAYALYGDRGPGWRSLEVARPALLDFLRLCVETVLAERGVRYDTVDAVLDAGFADVRGAVERALVLEEARETADFAETLSAASRVGTLLRFAARSELAATPGEVRIDLLQEEAEQALYGLYLDVRPRVEDAARQGDPAGVLRLLGEMAGPLDEFFDSVLVMSDDETLRTNRLRLLLEIHALFLQVADLTRLVTPEE